MSLSPYLLTVALHTVTLSVVTAFALLFLKNPQRRATTALVGLLIVGTLPWFSAIRTEVARQPATPSPITVVLPEWTVVKLPAPPIVERDAPPRPSEQVRELPDVRTLLAWTWFAGSVTALLAFLAACGRLLWWKRSLMRPDDSEWSALHQLLPAGSLREHFRITAADSSPCVAGILRTVIVLPRFLLEPGQRRELRWAVRHEVRHWQGGDSRWISLLAVIRIVHWWNPFVHGLIACWTAARERICDLHAADHDRAGYGEFLIAMASRSGPRHPLAINVVKRRRLRALRGRIRSLLDATPGCGSRLEKGFVVAILILLMLVTVVTSGLKIAEELRGAPNAVKWTGQTDSLTGEPDKAGIPMTANGHPGEVAYVQVKLSTTVLLSKSPIPKAATPLNRNDAVTLLTTLAADPANRLVTLPSIVARSSETAAVAIVRDHPDEPPWKSELGQARPPHARFAGLTIHYRPDFQDGRLNLSSKFAYGFFPGVDALPNPATSWKIELKDPPWEKLIQKAATGEATLAAGGMTITSMGEVEPGKHICILTTVEPIDATGRPAARFEDTVIAPPETIPGKLKVSGLVVDRAVNAVFPGVTEISVPLVYGIFAADQWDKAKADAGLNGEALNTVEFPTDKMVDPWKAAEGLQIMAKRLKGGDSVLMIYGPSPGVKPEPGPRMSGSTIVPRGTVFVFDLGQGSAPGIRKLLFMRIEEVI